MSEMGPGPSPEELGIENGDEIERNPDQLDIEAAIADIEIENVDSTEIRSLAVDEVVVAEIVPAPATTELPPAQSGMDPERARLINQFFLERSTPLEAVSSGQNVIALGMICLNKDTPKAMQFGRVVEITQEPDPKFPDHAKPRFTLEYGDGRRVIVDRVKPAYDLNAKELAKMPPDYAAEFSIDYPSASLSIGNYMKIAGVDLTVRVAYHLDQEAFPGQIGLIVRDANSTAHLVATALENIEPRPEVS